LKGGYSAWGPLGEGNATVERAEPTRYRPDWGGSGSLAARLGLTFCAPGASREVSRRLDSARQVVEIGTTRGLTRADLALNTATAPVEVNPRDGTVSLAGRILAAPAATQLPLNRLYLLR
jgi:urease subunit alpha